MADQVASRFVDGFVLEFAEACEVVRCSGADAATFLHGQVSQDITAMAVGAERLALVLAPTGKLVALVRIARTGEAEFLIETPEGCGEAVRARLARFLLRVDVTLTLETGFTAVRRATIGSEEGISWPNGVGVSTLSCGPTTDGVGPVASVEAEALRVWCAVPHMGAELTEDMIPAEAGNWLIESTVSFTKGCYVGQELIARVDSRGNNTPRHMVQLRANEPLVLGELTAADGGVVGSVTSVAAVDGQWLALGFLARSAAETDVLSDANGVATEVVLTPGR